MIDYAALSASISVLVSALFKEAGKAFAGEAGKAVYEKAKHAWGALKHAFADDPPKTETLTRFEANPDRYLPMIQPIIRERFEADEFLAKEFVTLKSDVEKVAPKLQIVIKMREVEDLTGLKADSAPPGTTSIDVDVHKGRKVVGAEFGKVRPPRARPRRGRAR